MVSQQRQPVNPNLQPILGLAALPLAQLTIFSDAGTMYRVRIMILVSLTAIFSNKLCSTVLGMAFRTVFYNNKYMYGLMDE